MAAPVGAVVTIAPYDLVHSPELPDPAEGDWLVTWSERTEAWGTAYLIVSARQIRSAASPRRFSLRCRKLGPAAETLVGPEDRVFPVIWLRRDRSCPR